MLHDLESQRILIADDEPTNVELLLRIMEWAGYRDVIVARNGEEAHKAALEMEPDLIVLDLHMPGKDGYQVLEELRAVPTEAFLPILVYTADVTRETRERALSLGASDFLTKPGEKTEIKLRIRNLLALRAMQMKVLHQNEELEARVQERTRELQDTQLEVVERLALAGEFRDQDTGEHTSRVGEMSAHLAHKLGMLPFEVATIRHAARLHDLGKIGITDTILLKPGALSDEERDQMKRHTLIGAGILSNGNTHLLQMAEKIALTHHERWDGTGYPNGLRGEDIPIEGRIVAVVDVYDALTHARPYKEAWTRESAIQEIKRGAGTQFDPKVVEAFLQTLAQLKDHAA